VSRLIEQSGFAARSPQVTEHIFDVLRQGGVNPSPVDQGQVNGDGEPGH
jgi:hypothetical protein